MSSRRALLEELRSAAPVIAPSLLKCDFSNLEREVALLEAAGTRLLHWDVMDGHFVPNLSYGALVIERVRPLTRVPFDAHLMISEPDRYLDGFLKAGCQSVTIHVEAVPESGRVLRRIREGGALAGLALNPTTPVEKLAPHLADCDVVLVMSVEPGFGGQKFIPASVEKLRAVRSMLPAGSLLAVDGGIDRATIGEAAGAGAEVFIAGSAIFGEPDYGTAIQNLAAAARLRMPAAGLHSRVSMREN